MKSRIKIITDELDEMDRVFDDALEICGQCFRLEDKFDEVEEANDRIMELIDLISALERTLKRGIYNEEVCNGK